MIVYAVFCVIALGMLPISWRRSESMTAYVRYTAAPIVWLLLAASCLVALTTGALVDLATAHDVFVGGLIGSAFVIVVLMRRQAAEDAAGGEPASDDDR